MDDSGGDATVGGRTGTYEVFVDVRHHPRHCEDFEQRFSTCAKLVDTGDPARMVAGVLRGFAAEIAPEPGDERSIESILAALGKVRAHWSCSEFTHTRDLVLSALDGVACCLEIERDWRGAE